MKKVELRKLAFKEAAALLSADMDDSDLTPGLSEEDEDWVREFIRNDIVALLEKRGT